jgi:hypothetical protein
MHRARTPPFRSIGYHWFIRRDGTLEVGRSETEQGAHVVGQNTGKIGICWAGGLERTSGAKVGVNNMTPAQETSLIRLIRELLKHGNRVPRSLSIAISHRRSVQVLMSSRGGRRSSGRLHQSDATSFLPLPSGSPVSGAPSPNMEMIMDIWTDEMTGMVAWSGITASRSLTPVTVAFAAGTEAQSA